MTDKELYEMSEFLSKYVYDGSYTIDTRKLKKWLKSRKTSK